MTSRGTIRVSEHRCRSRVLRLIVTLVILLPMAGIGGIGQEIREQRANFDQRKSKISPSPNQHAAAQSLGAEVRWNRFGTPSSLTKQGGFLARGVAGDDAVAASRSFVRANKELFKLENPDALDVAKDTSLEGSNARAIIFAQRAGGLLVSPD